MTGALLLVTALAGAAPALPADPALPTEGAPTNDAAERAARAEQAAFTVAGSSAAGFVGGMLVAMPVMFSLVPIASPFFGVSVAAVILAGGAALGAFVGELGFARVGPSALVAGTSAAGALVGVLAGGALGGLLGGAVDTARQGGVSLVLGALAGGIVGGIVGAVGGGAGGASWLTPAER